MKIIPNRRMFERLRTYDLKVLFNRNWKEIASHVDVINVSIGGLCFLTKSAMRLEEKIILTFPFSTKFIILNSVVAWSAGREVGVEFSDDQKNIHNFIDIFNREYPEMENAFFKNKNKTKTKLIAPTNYDKNDQDKQAKKDFDCNELNVVDDCN